MFFIFQIITKYIFVLFYLSSFFFFEETAGMWGKVIYAACFIFALIDVTLWTTGNKQVKVITSKEVGLCVVQALLAVDLSRSLIRQK